MVFNLDNSLNFGDISNAPSDFDDSIENFGNNTNLGDSGFLDNVINNKIKEKMNQIRTTQKNNYPIKNKYEFVFLCYCIHQIWVFILNLSFRDESVNPYKPSYLDYTLDKSNFVLKKDEEDDHVAYTSMIENEGEDKDNGDR